MKPTKPAKKEIVKEIKKESSLQKYEPGDKVLVKTEDKEYHGVLMPTENPSTAVIKLDSGYNIGIDNKQITSITLVEKSASDKAVMKLPAFNPSKPTIAVLHTGGTIASKVDYTSGGVVASFTAEDLLQMFPELSRIANFRTALVCNIMSEDMTFSSYDKIAKAIEEQIKAKVDGVIVGHGTDTLAVTAASLAFMFEKLPIPVLVVGSQRSTDRGSTDGAMNLICAAHFIAKSDFAGVGICMHSSSEDDSCFILPATKTKKLHTTRRDAFKAINTQPIAKVDYKTGEVSFITKDYATKDKSCSYLLKPRMEKKVGVLRTYPGMNREIIDVFTQYGYKGLVLEGTGLGQAPTNTDENLQNYEALKDFIRKGGIVVLTSQCVFGRVHADVYTNCRRLRDIGVIFGEDMITETAHVKLAWLLGNYSKDEASKLITKNLKGEISERTGNEFL